MGKAGYQSGQAKPPSTRGRGFTIKFKWVAESSGATAAEFALILPVFSLVFFGILNFGVYVNSYIELANGVAAGARQASLSRGSVVPYSTTVLAVKDGAPNLTSANITVSISVNGAPCTSDTNSVTKTTPIANACQTTYSTAENTEAVVSATYPCNIQVLWVKFPSCSISSSASQIVE